MTAGLSDCVVELQRPKLGLRRGFNPVEERWKQGDVAFASSSSTKESGPDVAVVHYSDPERGAFARLSGFFCCRAAGTPLSLGTGKGGHR